MRSGATLNIVQAVLDPKGRDRSLTSLESVNNILELESCMSPIPLCSLWVKFKTSTLSDTLSLLGP